MRHPAHPPHERPQTWLKRDGHGIYAAGGTAVSRAVELVLAKTGYPQDVVDRSRSLNGPRGHVRIWRESLTAGWRPAAGMMGWARKPIQRPAVIRLQAMGGLVAVLVFGMGAVALAEDAPGQPPSDPAASSIGAVTGPHLSSRIVEQSRASLRAPAPDRLGGSTAPASAGPSQQSTANAPTDTSPGHMTPTAGDSGSAGLPAQSSPRIARPPESAATEAAESAPPVRAALRDSDDRQRQRPRQRQAAGAKPKHSACWDCTTRSGL